MADKCCALVKTVLVSLRDSRKGRFSEINRRENALSVNVVWASGEVITQTGLDVRCWLTGYNTKIVWHIVKGFIHS